tara:strand:+ start:22527 stop:23309 length:783 start_codon:yes stop_codon:yes gene_type:complete
MALNKYSAFYYGHTITKSNKYLNLGEAYIDANQRLAVLPIGSFTLTEFGNRVAAAMNTAGNQVYTVVLDRNTRKFTISAPNNFELLIDTGDQKAVSIFSLLGFTGSDRAGSNSYTANLESGSAYITQTPLKDFSDFDKNREKAEAQVKTTPSGVTEVISYSTLEKMKCSFPLITNYVPQRYIRSTNTGVEEVLDFLNYAIGKAPMEFIYDYQQPNNFKPIILDKTKESSKGVGFELKERVKDSLPGYYEISGLVFLKIEV